MDYIDPDALCPKKTDKLNHPLTHFNGPQGRNMGVSVVIILKKIGARYVAIALYILCSLQYWNDQLATNAQWLADQCILHHVINPSEN